MKSDNYFILFFQSEHKTYHLKLAAIEKFEEKLRDVERKLGILAGQGVPVIYERNQDTSWLILFGILAIAIYTMSMMRNVQIKSPQSMDFFVKILLF